MHRAPYLGWGGEAHAAVPLLLVGADDAADAAADGALRDVDFEGGEELALALEGGGGLLVVVAAHTSSDTTLEISLDTTSDTTSETTRGSS